MSHFETWKTFLRKYIPNVNLISVRRNWVISWNVQRKQELKPVLSLLCRVKNIMWPNTFHCVKGVQIGSFFWSVFSCIRTKYRDLLRKSPYSVRIQENKDQKKLRICSLFTQCLIRRNFKFKWVSLAENCTKTISTFDNLHRLHLKRLTVKLENLA